MLGPFKSVARDAMHGVGTSEGAMKTLLLFVAILGLVCVVKVTDVGISVADKDWSVVMHTDRRLAD